MDIGGSGPLAIDWYPGPHGDAVEAINEAGVGFFAPNGELLAVEFDEMCVEKDHQFLEFRDYRVEATIRKGKVTVKLHAKRHPHKKVA